MKSQSLFADKVCEIEDQCVLSKNHELNKLVDKFSKSANRMVTLTTLDSVDKQYNAGKAVHVIQKAKKISSVIVIDQLRIFLTASCSYQNAIRTIEKQRRETFDESSAIHQKSLKDLWVNLGLAEDKYCRKSKDWQLLGFQGRDPATDFRGMGLLGLQNLVRFSESDREVVLRQLSLSQHPLIGYSFAITGIDMTNLCYQLMLFGQLKTEYYSKFEEEQTFDPVEFFHKCYIQIFTNFGKFWFHSEPASIMDYGPIRERFEKQLILNLKVKKSLVMSY